MNYCRFSTKRERQGSQNLNKETFYRPWVTSSQCTKNSGKCLYSSIFLNYDDDDYSQGYGQSEETFGALTKDVILKPYISDHDFRSSNIDDDIGNNLYVFDIRYQKILESSQPKKVELEFS